MTLATISTPEEQARFEDAVANVDLGGFDAKQAMSIMTVSDLKFLLHFLREKRPVKALEIGVHSGGTTKLLLRELSPAAALYSVDYSRTCPDDPTRQAGYVAAESYDAQKQAAWKTYFGLDVSACIREIGGEIDFCILDTTHSLPGEILSYLAVLPYLKDGAVLVLHDLTVHAHCCWWGVWEALQHLYCTPLLFSAVFSREKFVHRQILSACRNIGAIVIDKALAMAQVEQVFNVLFMPWEYMPGEDILAGTLDVIREHYPPEAARLFRAILRYQRSRPVQAPINVLENARANCAYLLSKHGRLGVWAGDERSLREILGETLKDANVHLLGPEAGKTLAGKAVKSPESVRSLGLTTILVPQPPMRGPEYGRLFDKLTFTWGAHKVLSRNRLLGTRLEGLERLFRKNVEAFLSGGAKVAFWGIGRFFKQLMDEDLVAPAGVWLVDDRPGGLYGGKPIESPEVIRREGIETVVIPPVYESGDGRIPAEEIRRELENGFKVKTIVHLDEFFF